MKLQFLIFIIFLITLVENSEITTNHIMTISTETIFSNLPANQNQYYTIYVPSTYYKYTFKIKVSNTYISSSSSLSLSFIGHSSKYPNTISSNNIAQGSLYFSSIISSSGYTTYESSYVVTKSSINYLTFVLTPSKYINNASITITRIYSSDSSDSNVKTDASDVVFIIVFFSIFIFCVFFCIIFFVCRAFCECFKNSTVIQTSP